MSTNFVTFSCPDCCHNQLARDAQIIIMIFAASQCTKIFMFLVLSVGNPGECFNRWEPLRGEYEGILENSRFLLSLFAQHVLCTHLLVFFVFYYWDISFLRTLLSCFAIKSSYRLHETKGQKQHKCFILDRYASLHKELENIARNTRSVAVHEKLHIFLCLFLSFFVTSERYRHV